LISLGNGLAGWSRLSAPGVKMDMPYGVVHAIAERQSMLTGIIYGRAEFGLVGAFSAKPEVTTDENP
jgi:hypothetical protein